MPPEVRLLLKEPGTAPEFLYRIFPAYRLLSIFDSAANVLVSPLLWGDQYEAAHLRVTPTQYVYGAPNPGGGVRISVGRPLPGNPPTVKVGTMRLGTNSAQNVYCQCWSRAYDNAAMWTLYGEDAKEVERRGILVKARADRLLSSLVESLPEEQAFLGEVEYFEKSFLDEELKDVHRLYRVQMRAHATDRLPGESIARLLLRKRVAYCHEQEFRLMVVRAGSARLKEPPKTLSYAINPNEVFCEMTLDPTNPDPTRTQSMLRDAGYQHPVVLSQLNAHPNLVGEILDPRAPMGE